MSDPEIDEAIGIVVADGNVAGPVDHVVVDPVIPLERNLRQHVAKGCQFLRTAQRDGVSHRSGQRKCRGSHAAPGDAEQARR